MQSILHFLKQIRPARLCLVAFVVVFCVYLGRSWDREVYDVVRPLIPERYVKIEPIVRHFNSRVEDLNLRAYLKSIGTDYWDWKRRYDEANYEAYRRCREKWTHGGDGVGGARGLYLGPPACSGWELAYYQPRKPTFLDYRVAAEQSAHLLIPYFFALLVSALAAVGLVYVVPSMGMRIYGWLTAN
jgi:hypothetical protein